MIHPFWWCDGQPSVAPPVYRITVVPLWVADSTAAVGKKAGGVLVRTGLLTDGGYPYATGESKLWCDRLVRGLGGHEFDVYALSRSAHQEECGSGSRCHPRWCGCRLLRSGPRPPKAGPTAAATASGSPATSGSWRGSRPRRRYGLRRRSLRPRRTRRGPWRAARRAALRSRRAHPGASCRAPGANRTAQSARVSDHLAFTDLLERALRPLSLDWYTGARLGAVDLCHAANAGTAALPGLLAQRFFGVPLLVTEYGVQLRAHYLEGGIKRSPVRALLAALYGRLAAEVYGQAAVITPGDTHARRWQQQLWRRPRQTAHRVSGHGGRAVRRRGGQSGRRRPGCGDPDMLVWVGRVEPAKDLISLLHAFAEIHREEPGARLRIVGAAAEGFDGEPYLAHCRALAAQLFPDGPAEAHAVGSKPVTFAEIGGPEAPELADAYAGGAVVVLSSVLEGFPVSLVEAMLCGRATVSTDVGAVVEVIGGTGLVVPPRNPRALADACLALLRDPARRDRLGAAARARALELFTVEQNVTAFHHIYLDLIAQGPERRTPVDDTGGLRPFAHPAETRVAGSWTPPVGAGRTPSWAAPDCELPLPHREVVV